MFYFKSHPNIVRSISTAAPEVYLTFDDGPSADLTEKVLDILKLENAKASFFVIGEKALLHPEMITRMLKEGHAVFSHSIDHNFKMYFQSQEKISLWLKNSLSQLEKYFGLQANIFRPPIGIITPPLVKAAANLNVRLVLWNHRFFDTTFQWTIAKANQSIKKIKAGDIVLLHDQQKPCQHEKFLLTLQYFISEIRKKHLVCATLN